MMAIYHMTHGSGVIHQLFGGSLSIMSIYLTLVLLDLLSGYLGALKKHRWRSSFNLAGLFTKFAALMTIVATAALDEIAPVLGIQLPVNIALIWTGLLCTYEFGSLLENAHQLGLRIDWLMKWLAVFEDTLSGSKGGTEDE